MSRKKLHPASMLPLSLMLLIANYSVANDFGASVSANSLMSDNAAKSADEPIDERQDTYQLGLTADYVNWLVDADVNYNFYAQKFAEKSQVDDEYLDGSATLEFGKAQDPLGLVLSHSSRMLLQSPDAVDLRENQQEREIISAAPILRKRIFGADTIFLQGQASLVSFPDDDNQNSKRNSLSLGWTHPLSKISTVQFSAQQSEVSFDSQPTADYDLADATIAYSAQLRKINYRVEVGYNELSREFGESQGAPSYNASLGYTNGFHQISASLGREITDTSFGNGNIDEATPIPGSDGLSQNLDQIDRKKANLDWQTSVICSRCTFLVGLSLMEDDYLERDEISLNTYARTSFIYALSNAANITLRVDRSKYDFKNSQIGNNYAMNYFSLEYSYRFLNGFDVRLFARKEERDADLIQTNYDENVYGGGVGYFF